MRSPVGSLGLFLEYRRSIRIERISTRTARAGKEELRRQGRLVRRSPPAAPSTPAARRCRSWRYRSGCLADTVNGYQKAGIFGEQHLACSGLPLRKGEQFAAPHQAAYDPTRTVTGSCVAGSFHDIKRSVAIICADCFVDTFARTQKYPDESAPFPATRYTLSAGWHSWTS